MERTARLGYFLKSLQGNSKQKGKEKTKIAEAILAADIYSRADCKQSNCQPNKYKTSH